MNHEPAVSFSDDDRCLDTVQLSRLEAAFRAWAREAPRSDTRLARKRILLIFLLIRYTGAKLAEVLRLAPEADFDFTRRTVVFRGGDDGEPREVQLAASLAEEVRTLLQPLIASASSSAAFPAPAPLPLAVDPAFVRRKFYERAAACGFAKQLGGPEKLRRARTVELMRNDMPLPAVQRMMGHSTPNLTSAHISFAEDDLHRVTRVFLDREDRRKTSARNAFFGKVRSISRGDLQSLVETATLDGLIVTAVITNNSLERLGLKPGKLLTAEVKAPWVIVQKNPEAPLSSAENCFAGVVSRVTRGEMNTECVLRISDKTEICALISTAGYERLDLAEGEQAWALFSCSAVVLHTS